MFFASITFIYSQIARTILFFSCNEIAELLKAAGSFFLPCFLKGTRKRMQIEWGRAPLRICCMGSCVMLLVFYFEAHLEDQDYFNFMIPC